MSDDGADGRDSDAGGPTHEELRRTADEAQTLMDAASVFEKFIEAQEGMIDDGAVPDDGDSERLLEQMREAREACKLLSVSITHGLAEHGYVPDFDEPLVERRDDDTDFEPSAFR